MFDSAGGRTVMRLTGNSQQSYIDWLKSLGCVLYLPLSADGDLQDRISGLSLQLTGNGSMVWDSDEGMYEFISPNFKYGYVAFLNNGFNKNWFVDKKATSLGSVKMVTNSNPVWVKTITPKTPNAYYLQNTNLSACYNGSTNTSQFPRTLCNVGRTFNITDLNVKCYQDGTQYFSKQCTSDSLDFVTLGDGLCIANSFDGGKSADYYMKEVYLFNTVLDLATIRKIQGYE